MAEKHLSFISGIALLQEVFLNNDYAGFPRYSLGLRSWQRHNRRYNMKHILQYYDAFRGLGIYSFWQYTDLQQAKNPQKKKSWFILRPNGGLSS